MHPTDLSHIDLVQLEREVQRMRAEVLHNGMVKFGAWLKKSFRINTLSRRQPA